MNFYQSCLGGDLSVTTVGETTMKDQFPSEDHHKVVHALLRSGVIEFSATDWSHRSRMPKPGNAVAM